MHFATRARQHQQRAAGLDVCCGQRVRPVNEAHPDGERVVRLVEVRQQAGRPFQRTTEDCRPTSDRAMHLFDQGCDALGRLHAEPSNSTEIIGVAAFIVVMCDSRTPSPSWAGGRYPKRLARRRNAANIHSAATMPESA